MCHQDRIILVLEDDRAISNLMCFVLRRQGYTVLAASNSSEAIRLGQLHPADVALVLADVWLRNETAASAVASLREQNPEARVLLLSGFTLEGLFQDGWLEPGIMADGSTFFLQKPFSPELLLRVVESVLDRDGVTNAAGWGSQEVSCNVQRAY